MPDKLAERILESLGPDRGRLPVDIECIIRRCGVTIEWAGLLTKVIGLYIPGPRPIIVCKRAIDPGRARFTLAHELYHHCDYALSPDHTQIRFCRPDVLTERKANRFAGAILMPRCAVENLWQLGKEPWEMCAIFGVSRQALDIRLRGLGIPGGVEIPSSRRVS